MGGREKAKPHTSDFKSLSTQMPNSSSYLFVFLKKENTTYLN